MDRATGTKRAAAAITICALTATGAMASPAESLPLSDRIVDYRIHVTLEPDSRSLTGRETLTWRNATATPATELQFHLYLNAFKNSRTSFMRESGGVSRGNRLREGEWGYIDVISLKADGGSDLLPDAEFIRPDDGNPDDETVLRVPLPAPVVPGASIQLDIQFAARLPRVFARTGYKNDFYLVAQWFPKIGVLQDSGWNCHQFHNHSEFFADFGTYDVSITLPSEYVIGATGVPVDEPTDNGNGTTTHRYRQADVHDFAWTADPDYIRQVRWFRHEEQRDPIQEELMARALGIPPGSQALELGDVEVILLIQPEHSAQVDRHFAAVFHALRSFGYWYGPYPYRTLTVVDPAYGARGAGGMEYPTLITAGTSYFAPEGRLSPESVTVHEFGHQYWYGMVASNEFEEAFLDEGFTTYSTGLVLDKAYGPNRDQMELAPGIPYLAVPLLDIPRRPDATSEDPRPRTAAGAAVDFLLLRPFGPSDDVALNALRDLPFLNHVTDAPIDQVTQQRRRYLLAPRSDSLTRRSWEYIDTESYGLNSYARTTLMLRTLEGILGQDLMLRAMRIYFERNRFRHPSVQDFIATINEVAGRSLDGYFRQAIFDSIVMDYAVADLSSKVPRPGRGLFGPPQARRTVTREQAERDLAGSEKEEGGERSDRRENEVLVRRIGEFIWPQEITLRYEGAEPSRTIWDGEYRWIRYKEEGGRLLSAQIDPEQRMSLDINRSNNSRTSGANPLPGLKWWSRLLQWMQHVAYFYSGVP